MLGIYGVQTKTDTAKLLAQLPTEQVIAQVLNWLVWNITRGNNSGSENTCEK